MLRRAPPRTQECFSACRPEQPSFPRRFLLSRLRGAQHRRACDENARVVQSLSCLRMPPFENPPIVFAELEKRERAPHKSTRPRDLRLCVLMVRYGAVACPCEAWSLVGNHAIITEKQSNCRTSNPARRFSLDVTSCTAIHSGLSPSENDEQRPASWSVCGWKFGRRPRNDRPILRLFSRVIFRCAESIF